MDLRVTEKYEIQKEIGKGNYGIVYLAKHKQLGTLKAIKELTPKTEKEKKRVEREIKLLQHAHHPHVIAIEEVFASEQATYICMEYAQGESLEKKLKGTLVTQESVGIVLDILRGIQTLHARGIIHRDLKPGNILFDEQDKVKIGDFGIATSHNVSVALTQPGTVLGTVGYMSPEQLLGNKNEVDEQSDIYAVGVMLYEMVAGEHPFRGKSKMEAVHRSLKGKYTVLLDEKKVEKELREICYKATHQNKKNRYKEAREMLEELSIYYSAYEDKQKKRIPQKVINKSKNAIGGLVAGILCSGIGLGLMQGENSVGNIWKRMNKEYRELSRMKGSEGVKDRKRVQENIHRVMYNGIQALSEKNITEQILEGEKLYKIGLKYYEGEGVEKNYEQAYKYFVEASSLGSIEASLKLGDMYFNGNGVENNDKTSMEYYELLTAIDDPRGYYRLGEVQLEYRFLRNATEYLEKSAIQGHEKSIEKLVNIYAHFNYDTKTVWHLRKGAELENSYCLLKLGTAFVIGEYGLQKNEKQGMYYIKKAIRNGNVNAIYRIMNMNLNTSFDKKKILKDICILLKNSNAIRDKGSRLACLAYMYTHGAGVEKNYLKAKELYEQAIVLGNSEALNNLGVMYEKGQGVQKNDEQAVKLYEQAKALGNSNALVNLGLMEQSKKEYDTAEELFDEAMLLGNSRAMLHSGDMYFYGYGGNIIDNEVKALYKEAMILGNVRARNNLGVMYYKGRGVDRDYEKAKKLYEQAIVLGDIPAITNLGILYHFGYGVERDYMKARALYERAKNLGDGNALSMLGVMSQNGHGVRKSYTEAKQLYKKAIELGSSSGLNNLGNMYYDGYGVKQDYTKAKELYEQAMELKNSDAMNKLGFMYQHGLGVNEDYFKATEIYRTSVALGNSDAMGNLGLLYSENKLYARAKEVYLKGIKLENTNAMNGLGYLYRYGLGVNKDHEKAKELYGRAIALGNTETIGGLAALYHLEKNYTEEEKLFEKALTLDDIKGILAFGVVYEMGGNIKENYPKAMKLYERAMELGSSQATYRLGRFYYHGNGVEKNYKKAKWFYERAIRLGDFYAMSALGRMYEFGIGVEKDYGRAKKLYEQAVKAGDTNLQIRLNKLEEKMKK